MYNYLKFDIGMKRMEVHCKECGGSFERVFSDNPKKGGELRYYINLPSLEFND
ncbi:MAG: peptide-methionine (R)-S-oxide reductase [Candidatus Hodarchaeota archaeon]